MAVTISRESSPLFSSYIDFGVAYDEEGNSEVMRAAQTGNTGALELCLEGGDRLNNQNNLGETALIIASEKGHKLFVSRLIESQVELNLKNLEDETALMIAAQANHIGIVTNLVENGADLEVRNKFGWTALFYAVAMGNTELVEYLSLKANVEVQDCDGWTPLMHAAYGGNSKMCVDLLLAGAKKDTLSHNQETAQALAIVKGHQDIIKILSLDSPLERHVFRVVQEENLTVLKIFIESRVNMNTADKDGWTPLHFAVAEGKRKCVKLLVPHVEIDPQDVNGWTPLMMAAHEGDIETYMILQSSGANQSIRCKRRGLTAIQIAEQRGFPEFGSKDTYHQPFMMKV